MTEVFDLRAAEETFSGLDGHVVLGKSLQDSSKIVSMLFVGATEDDDVVNVHHTTFWYQTSEDDVLNHPLEISRASFETEGDACVAPEASRGDESCEFLGSFSEKDLIKSHGEI